MRTIFHGYRPGSLTHPELENTPADESGVNAASSTAIRQSARQINTDILNLRSRSVNLQEAVFSQSSSVPDGQTEYFAHLDAWVRAGGTSGGNRTEAINRIKEWINADQTNPLNLSCLELTSLPATLPSNLLTLYAAENQLGCLPDTLPPTLHTLYVSGNQLTSLPNTLPLALRHLYAADNQLTSLPDTLPPALHSLYAADNQLSSLPDTLPPTLDTLDASANQLTSLPENILALPNTCSIYIDASHLSEAVRNRLSAAMNVPGYSNVQIDYDMGGSGSILVARSLQEEVCVWKHECSNTTPADWSAFQSSLHAPQFAQFLLRLRETSQYLDVRTKSNFQQRVVNLLRQLQDDAELRGTCFNLAHDAVETCGDRVALRMLNIETVCFDKRMEVQIRAGEFNNNPQVVVNHVRAQYRLQALADAASAKIETLHFCDEVEVMLGFIVAFGGEFKLNVQMDTLLYGACSNITPEDVYETRKILTNQAFTDDTKKFYKPFFEKFTHSDPVPAVRLNALPDYRKSPSEIAQAAHSFHRFMLNSPAMTALFTKIYPVEVTSLKQDCERKIAVGQTAIRERLDALDLTDSQYSQQCINLKERYCNLPQKIRAEALNGLLVRLCREYHFDACDV